MASMADCENIAQNIATKLGTSIKTKASGTDTGMAWCNGTFANNLTYQVLNNDAGTTNGIKTDAAYNVTIRSSNTQLSVQTSTPGSWSTSTISTRAANAWNGAQS